MFSKEEAGQPHYVDIARGTWILGRDPVLEGEAIPPEVLKGMEKQTPAACEHSSGVITYDLSDIRYAMQFEAIEESASGGSV
jgi:hypothetical protein